MSCIVAYSSVFSSWYTSLLHYGMSQNAHCNCSFSTFSGRESRWRPTVESTISQEWSTSSQPMVQADFDYSGTSSFMMTRRFYLPTFLRYDSLQICSLVFLCILGTCTTSLFCNYRARMLYSSQAQLHIESAQQKNSTDVWPSCVEMKVLNYIMAGNGSESIPQYKVEYTLIILTPHVCTE